MGVGARSEQLRALDDAAQRVAPAVVARDRRLEVSAALADVLPGGLQRGTTVGVRGPARVSLALAVAAGPVAAGSWLATVGCEELCLVAAEQAGVALHRMVLVAQPPRSSWGAVVAAMVDAFDVVLVSSPASSAYRARTRDARRLVSRARERGSVLIDAGGLWPDAHDVVLEVTQQHWLGLGEGHGVLTARQVEVAVSGRRGTRPRQVPLWLPGPTTAPEAVPAAYAGSDVDRLVDAEPVEPVETIEPVEPAALPQAG